MKTFRLLILAGVLAASCSKGPGTVDGLPIAFSTGMETKAFLDSEDINVEGTALTIHGFNGTNFIPGKTATYSAAGGWTLENTYFWEDGKDYTFFAWLGTDKDGHATSGIDGTSVAGSRSLGVSAKAFDFAAEDNNFDFCYSDVVYRPSSESDRSVVRFTLKHLYTGIAFSAHNSSAGDITLKEVTLKGLKNSKSATISFADSGVSTAYGNQTCTWTGGSRKINSSDISLPAGGGYGDIVGSASGTASYHMFWPQTEAELDAIGWTDSDTEPEGGAYIKVVYNDGTSDVTKYARFPKEAGTGWPAGTKRLMDIAIADGIVTLKVSVADWTCKEPEIKYDDEVTVDSALRFDPETCTIDEAEHKVYFKGANPIRGLFKITAPEEGIWIISKEGDFDVFEIDNATPDADGNPASIYADGADCNYGAIDAANGNAFTLYKKTASPGRDCSIQLSFSVRYPDGQSYCIDDRIQPDGKWTIILTK